MARFGLRGGRFSRETRLLILTISVSALVLLLLARLRFPEPPAVVDTTVQPLERLAARAPYDLLASSVARLEETIAPSLIVLRVAPRGEAAPLTVADLLTPARAAFDDVRHVPAVRIGPTAAVAAIASDLRITGIVGQIDPGATAGIIGADAVHRLALVRVPEAQAAVLSPIALGEFQTPAYVVVVEGTHAGLTMRPVFLGRGDRFMPRRWARPLLPLGGVAVTPGSLVFTLEGRFLGLVVMDEGVPAIASAQEVIEIAERLAAAPAGEPADLGVAVQPLTEALARATGATSGVVVADVDPGGPAAGVLEPGDVIVVLGGSLVSDPEALLLDVARRPPGSELPVTVVRGGESEALVLTLGAATGEAWAADAGEPLTLRLERGVGSEVVRVAPGSPFDLAGVDAGDFLVRAGPLEAPTPAQVLRLVAEAQPGDVLVIVARRPDGRQRVLAVQVPSGSNGTQ